MKATITGWGSYLPPAVLTNDDLATVIDTSDEWIQSRSGIRERRMSHIDTSEMSVHAARSALASSGVDPQDIDLIVLCTCSPDRLMPSTAAYVQKSIGAVNAGAFDLNAACTGFVYGLSMVTGMIESGHTKTALVIGAEKLSTYISLKDRSTAVLFGDGAGAVIVQATEDVGGVEAIVLGNDGTLTEALTIPGSGSQENPREDGIVAVTMDGPEIYRGAIKKMAESVEAVVAKAGWELDDVALIVPHQANIRIIDAVARRLKIDPDKAFVNIMDYGNTSAATVPIAIADAVDSGRIKTGDKVVFVAFGAGVSWGAVALEWGGLTEPKGTYEADVEPPTMTGLELLQAHQG
ncbi:MAG: ketoacyl-ACP synthase III [Acidobacteria bacterium]|nr:ketoacyl-ACP synthase III [Acidobacteriota bacterium]